MAVPASVRSMAVSAPMALPSEVATVTVAVPPASRICTGSTEKVSEGRSFSRIDTVAVVPFVG